MAAALAVAGFTCCTEKIEQSVSAQVSIGDTGYAYSVSATNLKPGETLQVVFTATAAQPQQGLVLQFLDDEVLISEFPFTYRKTVHETGVFPLSVYSDFHFEGENILFLGKSETTIQIKVTE